MGTGFEVNGIAPIPILRSEVNISGGTIDLGFNANSGTVVNISGGTIGDSFHAFDNSEVNLIGSDFALDGAPLDDSLTTNDAFTIVDRDVTLTGIFTDGSPFSFDLNSADTNGEEFFSPTATLTVTLFPPRGIGRLQSRRCRGLLGYPELH